MNLLQRAFQRLDLAAVLEDASWTTNGNTYFGLGRPVNGREQASAWDYEAAVRFAAKNNGPIFALMQLRQLVFSEARFQFRQLTSGRGGKLFGNPDLQLLETPWTNGTTGDLLSRMSWDADLDGNSFITNRNPGRLKRMRPDWTIIVTGSQEEPDLFGDALDGDLLGYGYAPRGNWDDAEFLLPEEVAHYAPVPDPDFHFRGMSWLTPIVREITADTAATRHKLKFFEQGGTPQLIVSMDAKITPDQFAKFKATMDAAHAGVDTAYKTLYLGGGADVTVAGKDLRQLDFKVTQGAGESRLAAAAGVPPSIVGFSEGLAGSSLNAGNYMAARRRFADATMRPLWRFAAGALATLVKVPAGAELWYDERGVAFLRDDSKDAAEIQGTKSRTIRQLVDAGFEPASVIAAVEADDYTLLVHTGLYSVQLQKPSSGEIPTTPTGGQQP